MGGWGVHWFSQSLPVELVPSACVNWLDFNVLWFSQFLCFAEHNPSVSCTRLPFKLNLT